jgi:MYXO-CTERM domain-containing protein
VEQECKEGICVEPCIGNCFNKECGSDGCDGTCGLCAEDESCTEGLCLPAADGDGDVVALEEVWSYEDANGSGGKDGIGGFVLEDTEGSGQVNNDDCPEGEKKRYGKCVPVAPDDDSDGEGDKAGGCSTGMEPTLPSIWLLLGLLALIGLRRISSCGRGARVTG